jgi:hypothetical protein
MSELSPQARKLIEASRAALRPSELDRTRIETALQARLVGQSSQALDSTAASSGGATWKLVTGAAIGLCALGLVVLSVRQPQTQPVAPRGDRSQLAEPVPLPDLDSQPAAEPTAPAVSPPTAARVRNAPSGTKPPAAHSQDRLAVEVELLSRATRALRGGNMHEALSTLDEHQRRFPKGQLRHERRVAKAQALCALGRVREGQAELEGLPRDTPATARALRTCGF